MLNISFALSFAIIGCSTFRVYTYILTPQTGTLTVEKRKLQSDNKKLEQKQEKLQQEVEKMLNSKEIIKRNIHAYDENKEWQLPEQGALMSAKAYRDKKVLPLVEKLKEVIKI